MTQPSEPQTPASESLDAAPSWLERDQAPRLAYHYSAPEAEAADLPTLVFFPGYRSDMLGSKAVCLEQDALARGQGMLRFDYRGHGQSEGRFEDATISDWLQDSLDLIDQLTQGPLILVGSSMGGWLALLAALARRERTAGMLLIAPAPDFTRDLFFDRFDDAIKQQLQEQGFVELPNDYSDEPYHVSMALIEDGDRHLLLKDTIAFDGPVRILHGQDDTAVPWQRSLTLAEKLSSSDVRTHFLKGRDHRLSEDAELALLIDTALELSALVAGYGFGIETQDQGA